MPVQINDNGVLRTITDIQVNDNGTLRTCYAVQINDNGTLRTAYMNTVSLSNYTIQDAQSTGTTAASISANRDGTIILAGNGSDPSPSDEWADPQNGNPGDSYHARMTVNSGDAPDTGTVNSWLPLTSDREWGLSLSTTGQKAGTWTLEISLDSGTTATASSTITAQVDRA